MFNQHEKHTIISQFPMDIELCYEKRFHNKVHSIDYYVTIPRGAKYFAWFKTFNRQNYLFLLEIDRRKNIIKSLKTLRCCFDNYICYGDGTILYGTIFKHLEQLFFNVEDILYFKNQSVWRFSFYDKLTILQTLFNKHVKQVSYFNELVFGMPNMTKQKKNVERIIKDTPYPLYAIQHRNLYKKTNIVFNEAIDIYNIYCNFVVKANICPDTYMLLCMSKGKIINHSLAYISSYKQSCSLNKVFRNIKENDNLDALEESDDEDEFENTAIDKYIHGDKKHIYKCVYNRKFKLWSPISIVDEPISNITEVKCIEK
jgi:hypothetical protein